MLSHPDRFRKPPLAPTIHQANQEKGAYMASFNPPFPAPPGMRWVFCTEYRHWKAKRILRAKDYNKKAWAFLVPIRKG